MLEQRLLLFFFNRRLVGTQIPLVFLLIHRQYSWTAEPDKRDRQERWRQGSNPRHQGGNYGPELRGPIDQTPAQANKS